MDYQYLSRFVSYNKTLDSPMWGISFSLSSIGFLFSVRGHCFAASVSSSTFVSNSSLYPNRAVLSLLLNLIWLSYFFCQLCFHSYPTQTHFPHLRSCSPHHQLGFYAFCFLHCLKLPHVGLFLLGYCKLE